MKYILLLMLGFSCATELKDLSGFTPIKPPAFHADQLADPALDNGASLQDGNGRFWFLHSAPQTFDHSFTTIQLVPGLYGFASGQVKLGPNQIVLPQELADRFFVVYRVGPTYFFMSTIARQHRCYHELDSILDGLVPRSRMLSILASIQKVSPGTSSPVIGRRNGGLTEAQVHRQNLLTLVGQGSRALLERSARQQITAPRDLSVVAANFIPDLEDDVLSRAADTPQSSIDVDGREVFFYCDVLPGAQTITKLPGIFIACQGQFLHRVVTIDSSHVPSDHLFWAYLVTSNHSMSVLIASTQIKEDELTQVFAANLSIGEKTKLLEFVQSARGKRQLPAAELLRTVSAESVMLPSCQQDIAASFDSLGDDPFRNVSAQDRIEHLSKVLRLMGIHFELADVESLAQGILSLDFLSKLSSDKSRLNQLITILSDRSWIKTIIAGNSQEPEFPEILLQLKETVTKIYFSHSMMKFVPLHILEQFFQLERVSFSGSAHVNGVTIDVGQGYINNRFNQETIKSAFASFLSNMPRLQELNIQGTGLETNFQAYVNDILSKRSTQVQPRRITLS